MGELKTRVSVDLSEFNAKMDRIAKKAKKVGQSMQDVGKSMTRNITLPLVALGGVAVAAFGKQQRAVDTLRAAIAANGKEVGSTLADYRKFASELQKMTVVGDEATLQLLQMSEVLGSNAPKEAAKNAIAMARAVGINEKSALRMVVAAQKGDFTLLNRYIPALRGVSTEAEKAAIVQKFFASSFEVAKAEAEDGIGPLIQMKNAIGDLMEQFGAIIAHAINPFVKKLKGMVERFEKAPQGIKKVIVAVAGLAAGMGPALLALGGFLKILPLIKVALTALTGPVGIVVAAVVAAAGLIIANWSRIKAFFEGPGSGAFSALKDAIDATLGAIVVSFKQIVGAVKVIWDQIGDGILASQAVWFGAILKGLEKFFSIIADVMTTFSNGISGNWSGAWDGMKSLLFDFIDSVLSAFFGFAKLMNKAVAKVVGLFSDDMAASMRESAKEMDDMGVAAKAWVKNALDIKDRGEETVSVMDRIAEAINSVTTATKEAAKGVGEMGRELSAIPDKMKPLAPGQVSGGASTALTQQVTAAGAPSTADTEARIAAKAEAMSMAMDVAGKAISQFAGIITSKMTAFGGAFDAVLAGDPIGAAVAVFDEFAKGSKPFMDFMKELNKALQGVLAKFQPAFDAVIEGLKPLIPIIVHMAEIMSERLIKSMENLVPLLVIFAKLFDLIMSIVTPFQEILQDIVGLLVQLVVAILTPVMKVLAPVLILVAKGLQKFEEALSNVIDKITGLFSGKKGGKVPSFDTGGVMQSNGLAMLHAGERVLNPSDTRRFDRGGIGGIGQLMTRVEGNDLLILTDRAAINRGLVT